MLQMGDYLIPKGAVLFINTCRPSFCFPYILVRLINKGDNKGEFIIMKNIVRILRLSTLNDP